MNNRNKTPRDKSYYQVFTNAHELEAALLKYEGISKEYRDALVRSQQKSDYVNRIFSVVITTFLVTICVKFFVEAIRYFSNRCSGQK
jgi:hypothetical protein